MTTQELQEIVLRNTSELSEIRSHLSEITAKEKRAESALQALRSRLDDGLSRFNRDSYKSTDERLRIEALASEILIFERLGCDMASIGSQFVLGVAALLQGRNQAALDYFKEFLRVANAGDTNTQNANYLAGMICYNKQEFTQSLEFYEASFRCSPEHAPDWQSKIYTGELLYFLHRPREQIERVFFEVDEVLRRANETRQNNFLRATLWLKLGNCYVGTFDPPKKSNSMINTPVAIELYKKAREVCPGGTESLLPVVIDYSLAQALILEGRLDMDLMISPTDLLADVFKRLRKIVLSKREEIILAQTYFMLGTCAVYSPKVSRDAGEIYMEYARHQTLAVPSDVCFYSCITKELLSKDEFIEQIETYASRIEATSAARR